MKIKNPLQRYLTVQLEYERRLRRALSRLATLVSHLAKRRYSFTFSLLKELLFLQHNFVTIEIEPIIRSGVYASRLAAFTYARELVLPINPDVENWFALHNRQMMSFPAGISMTTTKKRMSEITRQVVFSTSSIRTLPEKLHDSFNPLIPGGASWPVINYTRGKLNEEFRREQLEVANPRWTKAGIWKLSDDHPEPDDCNALALANSYGLGNGVYPIKLFPPKPHYGCLCYVTYLINNDLF